MPAIAMLGPLRVEVGGRELRARDFGGVKPRQVLEILLVHGGQPVAKDRIADLLWGEDLPKDWRRALEAYVSVLRSALGPGGRDLVRTEPGAYRLALDETDLDTARFDALVQRAAGARGLERAALLDHAVGLVRGELLADEPYATWAMSLRDLYRERVLGALLDAAEAHAETGSPAEAIARAERVIAEQPTRERAYRVVMAAHVAHGERGLALQTYQRCRAVLEDELGVDPSRDTERLHLQILRAEPADPGHGRVELEQRPVPGPTRYAASGPVAIAYKIVGDGPPDLVLTRGFVSHIEVCWEWPAYADFLHRLAAHTRLIVFDKRGTGMSDPVMATASLEERADDLRAVLDAAGSTRAVLMGESEGGPLSIHFAVQHPEQVSGLVLYGTFARLMAAPDYPHGWPDSFFEAFLASIATVWATGKGGELVNPSTAGDPSFPEWLARYYRLSASPASARELMRLNQRLDVRHLLPRVAAPTLVLHRRDDPWVTPANARYLAQNIPGASYVELPGADHISYVGDSEAVLVEVERFLGTLPR